MPEHSFNKKNSEYPSQLSANNNNIKDAFLIVLMKMS